MSGDDDLAELMAAFKRNGDSPSVQAAPSQRKQSSVSPEIPFSEQASARAKGSADLPQPNATRRVVVAVRVPPIRNPEEYTYYEAKVEVEHILREYLRRGERMYEVKLSDGTLRKFTVDSLLSTRGGSLALQNFEPHDSSPSDNDTSRSTTIVPEMRSRLRTHRTKIIEGGMVDSSIIDISSDELATTSRKSGQRRHLEILRKRGTDKSFSRTQSQRSTTSDSDEHSDESGAERLRKHKPMVQEPLRRSRRNWGISREDDEYGEDEEDDDSSDIKNPLSDLVLGRKRKRASAGRPKKVPRQRVRQSDRATRAQNNMQEVDMDDIYLSVAEQQEGQARKIASVREFFQTLPRSNLFRSRHVEGCEVCSNGPSIAPLIYCQGCSLAYHKSCLGNRSSRDHLVTKVGDENFVLQCRRCINFYRRKDTLAPDLAKCQSCNHPSEACKPFRSRKTPQQEQKERDENDGEDPIVDVPSKLINNAQNVLFRCIHCWRAYHYHHLPPLSQHAIVVDRDESEDEDETADNRFQEYSKKWLCKDCDETEKLKVSGLIAWRPSNLQNFQPGTSCNMLSEDDKEYLIKWEHQSYFQTSWYSGAWTWGVTAPPMRKAFYRREDGPKMRTEDAIPEEFLRVDIVLDVKYTNYVEIGNEEIDKARIKEVDKALIKYKGLGYEDAVWEKVPTSKDGDRWLDFVTAYNDWVASRYVKYPEQAPLRARLEKVRGTPFSKLEKAKQPDGLTGGDLMKYQMEGLNWLYYQWHSQTNGILADEMGLGKTIQVIGFMATLIQDHNCFPFLVVVPNSTVANWRREIKKWAPSLRVVTYFGSAVAREMAYKYEMYPDDQKELRCHVIVTSYEAAIDNSSRFKLRRINWAGLIVDEGQRLKNDKSQLYYALAAVKAPFRLLLTGTPLQNNVRELFNLLQFLDDTINAEELEERYEDMTAENIRELHDQIRPFILRRTKAQVLTFLPPLGQIIVPLSMSVLQKTLYKSILAKNPELLKALFVAQKQKQLKQQERANLTNILMQLRKCLCHPFVYSRKIEERTDLPSVSHRNLVEASAKLQFLELMLPKLQERGHRVLIFSQFLDMLSIIEDFLDGMQMTYQRLDGTIGSLEKQKRIDQFNEPDSSLFAFLLSTRAGGVGINLATADTVIILDPDFNPHQDLQAISRAHRIGQKKKVLCFQLTTRASAEEKITQMGRKKMALDHVVVEQLDAEDLEDHDVESILKHGAAEIFEDGEGHDIRYDEASIDKLLDRTQMENTDAGGDNSAESQFSFARVWANDQGALQDNLNFTEETPADPGVWDKILKDRQAAAAAEALARADALGRGKRTRMVVDYATEQDADAKEHSPVQFMKLGKKKKAHNEDESDTDFEVDYYEEEDVDDDSVINANDAAADVATLGDPDLSHSRTKITGLSSQHKHNDASVQPSQNAPTVAHSSTVNGGKKVDSTRRRPMPIPIDDTLSAHVANKPPVSPFRRAQMPIRAPLPTSSSPYMIDCRACMKQHPRGACPLKVAGVEHCGLCGLAHYGYARTCPHIQSETQVRHMLEALKSSPEKKELVDAAVKYLRGVKGTLVQQQKKVREATTVPDSRDSNRPRQLREAPRPNVHLKDPHDVPPRPCPSDPSQVPSHPFRTSSTISSPQHMPDDMNR